MSEIMEVTFITLGILGALAFLAPKRDRWTAAACYIIAAPAFPAVAFYIYIQFPGWLMLVLSLCLGAVGFLSFIKAAENLFK